MSSVILSWLMITCAVNFKKYFFFRKSYLSAQILHFKRKSYLPAQIWGKFIPLCTTLGTCHTSHTSLHNSWHISLYMSYLPAHVFIHVMSCLILPRVNSQGGLQIQSGGQAKGSKSSQSGKQSDIVQSGQLVSEIAKNGELKYRHIVSLIQVPKILARSPILFNRYVVSLIEIPKS